MTRTVDLKRQLVEHFIEELPVIRAKGRLSQETVAEKIGVSRQTYSTIETGKREMTWTMFMATVAFFQNIEQTKGFLNQVIDMNTLETILTAKDSENK